MPDAALEATERQFVDLLRAAASKDRRAPEAVLAPGGSARRYGAPGHGRALPRRFRAVGRPCRRPDRHRHRAARAEPEDEPYWAALSQVVDWARDNTASTIWSCLAAHAAVLHVDGIERRPLADKLFGVFDCEPARLPSDDERREVRIARSAFALERFAGTGA